MKLYLNCSDRWFKVFILNTGLAIVFLILLAGPCNAQSSTSSQPEFPTAETIKKSELHYNLIPGNNNTWGYDIFMGDKLVIHQSVIPGMAGNNGFKNKASAQKVAEAVMHKMRNGEVPPSISKEELKRMNVL
ncbi:MAG: DUF4907 domain-containing protein [Sporocytophaga sp.]|uniref:DUF4907 domain-containing protein n=1 Tax=Sporocytophaga sp. TaxID=2231183 RepID=UPI001B10F47E|nr:DUF4907 domain-containing protein [Sporocytophaga sp.]MBO9702605.1 DUF4907 domain-containing protein [Sporocytophaga sp.]